MRAKRALQIAIVTVAALGAWGCPIIPEIESRVVDLAMGGSSTLDFVSSGDVNTYDDTAIVDLATIDLAGILHDAGVDVSDVQDIALSGVSYRVTKPDPDPNREILNGNVSIQRGAGTPQNIVVNFNELVNTVTSYKTATLDAAGVAVVNQILDDLLAQLQGGPPAINTVVTCHVTGDSVPGNVPTDFEWQLKIDITIVGTIEVDVVD